MRSFWYTCLTALAVTGCPNRNPVECAIDTNCDLGGGGVCTSTTTGNQWCAYPDEMCPSGFRFSEDAGDGLSEICVEGSRYTLTVQVGGNGSGNISADRAGFSCSADTCVGKFPEGTLVNLSAIATAGSFLGWSEVCRGRDGCSVTMDRNHVVGALFGTPGEALWAKQLGSGGSDQGHGIAIDNENHLIAVGEFEGTITPGGAIELVSAGFADIFVVKLDSMTGEPIWGRRLGGPSDDQGINVAVDGSNNIYVVGNFVGTVDFGGGMLTSQGEDGFVLKLDANGEFVWARQLSGSGIAGLRAVAVKDGAVVVGGGYAGSMTVDASTFTSANGDVFILSLSTTSGATTWIRTFGGSGSEGAEGLAIDAGGNVVATGRFTRDVNFGAGFLSAGGDFNHGFLLKLAAADGAHLVSKAFGGSRDDVGTSVVVDSSNNIILTGYFGATASFGCTNSLVASHADVADAFLVKYTPAGSCVWAKGFGGTGTFDRRGLGVTANSAGDVATTGWFCGDISFGGPTLTSASECNATDVFAARFTGDGVHLNSVRAGGIGPERGEGVAQSADGRFFAIGVFEGFAEFGGQTFTSRGTQDAFIVGLAPL